MKADEIIGNMWRAGLFVYQWQVARLAQPVDRQQWSMTPQTVNAVNMPLQNALNLSAAILEAPFFELKATDAFSLNPEIK